MKNFRFQLLALKVEGQEHLTLGLQPLMSKVEVQEHLSLGLQLSTPKAQTFGSPNFGVES